MKLTNKQKEQIKWVVWVVTILAMFTSWRVERAVYKTKSEITENLQDKQIIELKIEDEKLLDYVLQNKDGITSITTWIEYDSRHNSGASGETE